MNKSFWLTALLAGALSLPAADLTTTIEERERAWATAVASGDVVTLEKLYTDKLIYAHATGIIENKRQYLDRLKTGAQKYDHVEHEKTTVVPYGDAAVSHSIVRMNGTSNGKPFNDHVMLLHLWVKQGAVWRIAAHQTTRLPQ